MIRTTPLWAVLIALALPLSAAVERDRLDTEVPIHPSGVVVIDNPEGNIEITGGNEPKVVISAERVIRAADQAAMAEARQLVNRTVEGNEKMRVIRTVTPGFNPRWSAQVHYTVSLPRTASVKVISTTTQRIRVVNMVGKVSVKNFNGPVLVENASGGVEVETINGDVVLVAQRPITANTRLSSVNGSILVRAPRDAPFTWEADTVMGDAVTTFAVRRPQLLTPTRFRGSVNGPTNVTLVTETFQGNVALMVLGGDDSSARSIRALATQSVTPRALVGVGPQLPAGAPRSDVHIPVHQGFYAYETSIGNVRIDEIRGAARIVTGAGEVSLGAVFGQCDVVSHGGPLNLGDILGRLSARTEAGNITIGRAREGGTVATGGGSIQVQQSGGAIQLSSGGGDIAVRQALGPVAAETRSGDITIVLDRAAKGPRVTAKTGKGNIALTFPSRVGADIDAVVITADPAAHAIQSDFAGLSIQRDQVGGRTRIRATGKINGGGDRIQLHAIDGGIHIAVDAPRVSPMLPY